MHRRLALVILLVAALALPGCSTQRRPFRWFRHRPVQTSLAQQAADDWLPANAETLTSAPPRLPPGIELPPEPKPISPTRPSAATEPESSQAADMVIFAGFGK